MNGPTLTLKLDLAELAIVLRALIRYAERGDTDNFSRDVATRVEQKIHGTPIEPEDVPLGFQKTELLRGKPPEIDALSESWDADSRLDEADVEKLIANSPDFGEPLEFVTDDCGCILVELVHSSTGRIAETRFVPRGEMLDRYLANGWKLAKPRTPETDLEEDR